MACEHYCKIGKRCCGLKKEHEGKLHCFTDREFHKMTSVDVSDFLVCPWPHRQEEPRTTHNTLKREAD